MRGDFALKLLLNTVLAIESSWIERILAIITREKDISALAAKDMKPYKFQALTRGTTAVLPIDGPIFSKADLFSDISGAVSTERLAKAFQTALDDDAI